MLFNKSIYKSLFFLPCEGYEQQLKTPCNHKIYCEVLAIMEQQWKTINQVFPTMSYCRLDMTSLTSLSSPQSIFPKDELWSGLLAGTGRLASRTVLLISVDAVTPPHNDPQISPRNTTIKASCSGLTIPLSGIITTFSSSS